MELRIFRLGYLLAALAVLAPAVAYADDDSGAGAATSDQQQPGADDTGAPSDQDNPTPAEAEPPHDFASGVAALNADSFDDKIAAVNYLGGLNDPQVVTVLQALADDNL